jgi:hypothetical protein
MSFFIHFPCSEVGGKWKHKEDVKVEHKIESENLKGRDHVEDLGVGRRVILEYISDFCGVEWVQARDH